MTVTFHVLQRCDVCEGQEMCPLIRREAEQAVQRIEYVAAFAGRKLPDAVLVLDCATFWRRGRSHG